MTELTREENYKRAQAGMREDRGDGIWAQHNHKYGLNSTSFQGIDLGEPYKPSRDPEHNCELNGCRSGNHYIKPKFLSRSFFDEERK
jgi:hypothetical protein